MRISIETGGMGFGYTAFLKSGKIILKINGKMGIAWGKTKVKALDAMMKTVEKEEAKILRELARLSQIGALIDYERSELNDPTVVIKPGK